MRIWVLSQFYICPEFGFIWPICSAYGDSPCCPWHPMDAVETGAWGLIRLSTTYQHIEAMKLDPRCLYVGGDYDTPHQQVLDTFSRWLDPNKTYMFMGQVICDLGKWSPTFLEVDANHQQ
jgi:hypothetical protein